MPLYDISNNYNDSQYINAGDQVILMKSGKALMYVPLQGSTHWYLYNLSHNILTWDHQRESTLTNKMLEIKVIIHYDDEADDDHHISVAQTAYNKYNVPFPPVITDIAKSTFKATTQMEHNLF